MNRYCIKLLHVGLLFCVRMFVCLSVCRWLSLKRLVDLARAIVFVRLFVCWVLLGGFVHVSLLTVAQPE